MLVLLLSVAIIILDQVTKQWVTMQFYLGESVPVIPGFFNFAYVRNTGAAWGMLGGLNGLLVGLSLVVLLILIFFRRSFLTDTLIHRLALAFMIGGIVGNLLDRVRLQYVVDFLDFYWRIHHFPAFNVADSAICIGVGLYMLSTLFPAKTQAPE
jgi:signal peptidase II